MGRTRKSLKSPSLAKDIKYLSEAEVIAINEEMIALYGGLHGVRDLSLLKAAIGRPQLSVMLQDAYPSIFDKAASLFHSIIKNHPFLDGNKRTSLFSAILFLEYNGFEVNFKMKEAVEFTLKAHNDNWALDQIALWFEERSQRL